MKYDVTITWMDGTERVYPCDRAVVQNDVLLLTSDNYSQRDDSQGFPLANIREWKAERR